MRCPWCGAPDSRVVDSRPAEDGTAIRRRRQCASCGRRFTTFERGQSAFLRVIKRDGSKEPYDRQKLVDGVRKSIKNRPVTEEQVAALADRVEETLRRSGPEVTSQELGLQVLAELRALDEVAYLRFASVYKDFQEVTDFERELGLMLQKREPKRTRRRR
ncbi:MAG TPA: transcriptional regulator NrdR [Actinomycetota bacterium]|nr:transcriptional regulator NrdR [Actinomycetota bacterium]